MAVDTAEDLDYPDVRRRAGRARARPALHPPHADPDLALHQRARRGRALLQVRELPEGRRLQGARRLQRRLRPVGRAGEEGRGDPLLGQPRAVALLRRRPPRHPLPRGDAAHRAAGEEGRGDRLRRQDHRVRALDLVARGGLRPGAGRDRRRLRAPLQRRAGDRRPGHLLEGDHRGPGPARCGGRPDRRRRHDLRHLPDALEHRAADEDLRRRAASRPTTPTSRSSRAGSSPTTRRTRWPTASRCRSRSAPGTSSRPTSPTC